MKIINHSKFIEINRIYNRPLEIEYQMYRSHFIDHQCTPVRDKQNSFKFGMSMPPTQFKVLGPRKIEEINIPERTMKHCLSERTFGQNHNNEVMRINLNEQEAYPRKTINEKCTNFN